MNNKSNWNTLDEVITIAELNPKQQFWCISNDGKTDFIMTAIDIKNTIGNYDWTGVKFGFIEEDNSKNNNKYISKAIPKTIKFSSRASVKVQDNFYTIEYRRRKTNR